MNRSSILLYISIVGIINFVSTSSNWNTDAIYKQNGHIRNKRDDSDKYGMGKDGPRLKCSLPQEKHEQIATDEDIPQNTPTQVIKVQKQNRRKNNDQQSNNNQPNKNANVPRVATTDGVLKGLLVNDDDVQYYSFLNIPYAEPPQRFQPPKPPKPWKGVRDATKEGSMCYQKQLDFGTIGGKEDCLYLNIQTPTLQSKRKLPVLIWIYGGMFKFGTANNQIYNPSKLIKENIILVSIYYRVGVFGFLSTNTKHAPGNVGFKDIVMALRWLRKNIHMFGGDTYNLCLYGVSSGGATVEYLNVSPLAKGLYDKVISQSGSALSPSMRIKDPIEQAFKLGRYLGFRTRNIDKLMEFLMKANASSLIEAQDRIDSDELSPFKLNFGPTLEKYITKDTFLTMTADTTIEKGEYHHVPYMIGFNDREGTHILQYSNNVTALLSYFDELFEHTIIDVLEGTIPETRTKIIQKIKSFYFKGKPIGIETIEQFVDFAGDLVFLYGIQRSAHIRAQYSKAPLYYFQFAYYDGDIEMYNPAKKLVQGVGHTQDLAYVFKYPHKVLDKPESLTVSKMLVKMYSNFLRYGNPTPEKTKLLPVSWPKASGERALPCLVLTNKMDVVQDPYYDRYLLWNELYWLKNCQKH